jgi:maltooligosyltrehalose trehalohydrolase
MTLIPEPRESLGATSLDGNRCAFLVWAPRAKQVEVHVLEPRERVVPMEIASRGYFRAIADDIGPGARYRYRLDGVKERPDPASRHQPHGVHGPSEVVDSRFSWNDRTWEGIPLEDYVLYELHVGTFTPEGTLDAIIPRIPILRDLGVTAIEVMPVSQFPGNRNWGYDGVYPYAVQESYGGPIALKRFVDACHRQQVAVVFDAVYNHLGPEGNYLADYGPYFTNTYRTPWGEALNFDGRGSDEVRRYFIENALQWVSDFHFDALRLDAVHAIVDPSARPFLEELGAAVHARAKELDRRIYLFPESDRNDARLVHSREAGGCGLDSVWNDDFHHALHVLLTGEKHGYYEDFRGVDDLARAYREGFVYEGQYSRFRGRRHGNSSKHVPGERLVVFAQNHDQVGNRRMGDRLTQQVSFEQLKLAAGALLLSPYIPLLFMGEEYGESSPFQYFVSHGDPELIEAVRHGRKEEFARFGWRGEIPDPQSETTFLASKLHWELRTQHSHHVLWDFYKELIRLRRAIPALARLAKDRTNVTSDSSRNVLQITRWDATSRVFGVFRFDAVAEELVVPVPAGRWKKLLDSSDQRWSANQSAGSESQTPDSFVSAGEVRLRIAPWSFALFAEVKEDL